MKQFSCASATIKWYQGKKVLKILGENIQTIEQRLRAGIEISRSQQINIEASDVQGGLPEPQNNTSVKDLSEIRPLINKTKASDAKTKVCNCDCICIDKINTSDGKLDLSISEFKLSAEISQNALEIDSLKAKQKDLEVKIQQQEEMIHKLNQENSDFKFKFESLENLILRLTHNNQENNDCGL